MTDQVHAWYKGPGIVKQTPVPERRFLGHALPAHTKIVWGERIYSTYLGETIPDDVVADRTFQCTCSFKAITQATDEFRDFLRYEIEVEGFFREKFFLQERHLKVKRNPDLTVPAVVEIRFRMVGKRFEKPTGVTVSSAIIWHRDEDVPNRSVRAKRFRDVPTLRLLRGDFHPRHEGQGGCLDILLDALGGDEVGRGF